MASSFLSFSVFFSQHSHSFTYSLNHSLILFCSLPFAPSLNFHSIITRTLCVRVRIKIHPGNKKKEKHADRKRQRTNTTTKSVHVMTGRKIALLWKENKTEREKKTSHINMNLAHENETKAHTHTSKDTINVRVTSSYPKLFTSNQLQKKKSK